MRLATITDDWLGDDERAVLAHLDELVQDLVGEPIPPGAPPGPEDVRGRLRRLQEHGWLELALDRELPGVLLFEAVKRVHRRDLPLPVPLLEVWCGLRLLATLAPSSAAAAALLEGCLAGARHSALAVDDLFRPGEARAGLRSGWVPYGDALTTVLPVRRGEAVEVYALPPDAGSATPAPSPDPTLPAVRRELTDAGAATHLGTLATDAWAQARAEVLVAQSAALTGQAQALLSATVAHLRVREQFGVPIGSFQALRHRAADLAAEVHTAQQLSAHAGEHVRACPEPVVLGLLAKSFTGRAAMLAASEAVQLHGGMGFTWEGGVHFGLKRCMYLAMNGLPLGACEERLGRWAARAPALLWAGGLVAGAPADEGLVA